MSSNSATSSSTELTNMVIFITVLCLISSWCKMSAYTISLNSFLYTYQFLINIFRIKWHTDYEICALDLLNCTETVIEYAHRRSVHSIHFHLKYRTVLYLNFWNKKIAVNVNKFAFVKMVEPLWEDRDVRFDISPR